MLADACGAVDRSQPSPGGFGSIAEYPGPFPGYTAAVPRSCAPLPRILRENGYVTGGFGKWHLTPDNVQGAAGPFDHWPQRWGFDHWWGFAFSTYAGMDIGRDNGLVVDRNYEDKAPYAFSGAVHRVVFDLKPAMHAEELALHEHAGIHAVAHGAGA